MSPLSGTSGGPHCPSCELYRAGESCSYVPTLKQLPLFPTVVYPSLESDEDNPVFKSRSKKRKSSDDAPYSPTGKSIWSALPKLELSHAAL